MDDDTTTMCRIRNEVNHPVEKWSDMGHTKTKLGNKLYKLREKFVKELSQDNIKHLQKCFMYAIQSNKNDPESIKKP